jgi:hypothetical protein
MIYAHACRAEVYFQEAYNRNRSKLDALVGAIYLRHMTAKVIDHMHACIAKQGMFCIVHSCMQYGLI